MLDIKEIKRRLENGEEVRLECVDKKSFINIDHGFFIIDNALIADSSLLVVDISAGGSIRIKDCQFSITSDEFKYFKIKEKSYTGKLLDRDSKFTELLSVATKAVNNGDLSSFVVNVADSSDKIGECLYIGANMTYHAIENEIKGLEMKEELEAKEEIKTSDFYDLIDVAIQAYKDGVLKSLKLLDCGVHSLSYSVDADVNGDENTIFSQHKDYSDGINFINSLYTETFVIKDFHDTKALKKGDKAVLGNGEEVIFTNRTGVDNALWFEYNDCHRAIIPFIALKGATVTQQKGNK